jgi:hypothetical protein
MAFDPVADWRDNEAVRYIEEKAQAQELRIRKAKLAQLSRWLKDLLKKPTIEDLIARA